jgi:hypothetical protein
MRTSTNRCVRVHNVSWNRLDRERRSSSRVERQPPSANDRGGDKRRHLIAKYFDHDLDWQV